MSQSDLISRDDLRSFASSAFVDGFAVRPLVINCTATGALGVATFSWQFVGDSNTSSDFPSVAGATWTWSLPDPAFASVTFPAQAYTSGDAWTVAPGGTLTPVSAAPTGLTASRFDVVAAAITSVSSQIATWTQPRCVAPIVSIGPGAKRRACDVVIYDLRSRDGLTPSEAGAGDDNIRARAEAAERFFISIGSSTQRPPDIIDSSASGGTAGAGFQMPVSRSSRGFGDFS